MLQLTTEEITNPQGTCKDGGIQFPLIIGGGWRGKWWWQVGDMTIEAHVENPEMDVS